MADRPNVILFVTDDHGPWTFPCYGNSEVRAPVFDKMAREGALFHNAFTPTPVCSPARACVLTGLTSSQHGVHDFIHMLDPECEERDWLDGCVTLAELLQHEGYRCGLSGKWHIGQSMQTPRGYEWSRINTKGQHVGEMEFVKEGQAVVHEGNRTEVITDYAIEFLNEQSDDKPFFLHIGYLATHSPYIGQDEDLVASYDKATFCDIEMGESHPLSWNEGFAEGAVATDEEARIRHMNQYAAVTDIDQNVGRILDRLEVLGQMENTVVIYTSDHGLSLGQHGFWGKGNGTRPVNMYDVSIRVPLIVYGAGISGGVEVERCVDHFDTFQTVCELGGVKLDLEVRYPGQSYLPLAMGGQIEDWDDTRYGEYGDVRMIRTPHYKLVRRYLHGPDDLYDLKKDPGERENLSNRAEMASTREVLLASLEIFYSEYEDVEKSGLRVKALPRHNNPQKPSQVVSSEAWRDGIREKRGLQKY